jgi:hypothetical protein
MTLRMLWNRDVQPTARLILCEDARYLLELAQVAACEVTRTLPAKGGGGSTLSARCQTDYAACPTEAVRVAEGERADDLNGVAADLAAATGKPFTLGDYGYDA